MKLNNNQQAFLSLVRAGLWETEVRLLPYGVIDFNEIYRLAQEQSILGLVAAGLEHVKDINIPKDIALLFAGEALQLEQRNIAMNYAIGELVDRMKAAGIYSLLVKGQGIAQCYERPLWRAAGDIDLLFDSDNYAKAAVFLSSIADNVDANRESIKHYAMQIGPWEVELHGTLRSQLGRRIDKVIDEVQEETFSKRLFRTWINGSVEVGLPTPNNDVIFIFTHILQHFFDGGIGLRQVCDWCRLLWVYRDSFDKVLLERRLIRMGLMTEWWSFSELAISYLGLPMEAMPLCNNRGMWKRKSNRILSFIMETGNFGHNRDLSYRQVSSATRRRFETFLHISSDTIKRYSIFPFDSLRVWCLKMKHGLKMVKTEAFE